MGMDQENEYSRAAEAEWLVIQPVQVSGSQSDAAPEHRVRLWALVLDARSVPCRIHTGADGWQLLVPPDSLSTAYIELRLFEEENRNWPPPVPPVRPLAENTLATLSVLVLLATFHNIVQLDSSFFGYAVPDWIAIGTAQASRIRDGQWWRLITALTLHADLLHLLSTLAIGGVFVILLCRELGSGLAWCLLLGTGTLGNLVNAFVQSPTHSSVGASTAVFSAVGILAALRLVRYRQHLQGRWPLPMAAALGLLALLGTEGRNTDVGAHLFGFFCGVCMGLITEYLVERYGCPGRMLNGMLALISLAVVVAAWWVAMVAGG